MKPVYISGRGLTCALGLNLDQSLKTLRQGNLELSTCFLPGEMGGQFPFYRIPNMNKDWLSRAREIVRQVALEAGIKPATTGVLFIASSSFDIGAGEVAVIERNYGAFKDKVVEWLEWRGPVYMINTACTSSMNALLAAQALLDSGEFEEALVLGIELENLLTQGGFAAMQLLSRSHSKPFGIHRDGLVLGEAVAALRLTLDEPAKWKMLGGENVVDGTQPTGASVSAVVSMYRRALIASGLTASDIDLIKVQAAGSPGNDRIEAQGLHTAFVNMPALVSLKTAIGHTMGASGVAEIALLTACVEQNVWPVCTDMIDAALALELAPRVPENIRHVMATILGFGGSHASVVLEQS